MGNDNAGRETGRGARIQVIDRAAALLDAIARYPEPVSLKILGAETGLHASTAHRILASLIDNRFVEGDVVVYIEKATPNRMMHVQQVVGSRAPLHVTAVGKLMLGAAGEEAIRGYAQRTNLPSYTRNTLSALPSLIAECNAAVAKGYALDNEEAEIDVGCIGVLLYDGTGNPVAGLSVSAPIERRRMAWVEDVIEAGKKISAQLGPHA